MKSRLLVLLCLMILFTGNASANKLTSIFTNSILKNQITSDLDAAALKAIAEKHAAEYKRLTKKSTISFIKFATTRTLIFVGSVMSVVNPAAAAGAASLIGVISEFTLDLTEQYTHDTKCLKEWKIISGQLDIATSDEEIEKQRVNAAALVSICPQ